MFFGGGDPFEHFGGGGGAGARGGRRPSSNVDTTKLYETLGVSSAKCHFFLVADALLVCACILTPNVSYENTHTNVILLCMGTDFYHLSLSKHQKYRLKRLLMKRRSKRHTVN